MRAVVVLSMALLMAVAVAMPVDHAEADDQSLEAGDLTEVVADDSLLESVAAAGVGVGVGAVEQFSTAPYKFYLWNPTDSKAKSPFVGKAGPNEIIAKLRAALNGAKINTKCSGTTRCVLLGPEFVGRPSDHLTEAEYGAYKTQLKALSAEAANYNVLLAPGTFVFETKGSDLMCKADKLHGFGRGGDVKFPGTDNKRRVGHATQLAFDQCLYAFNVMVVAFRGSILIEHYKKSDGSTAVGGPAFELLARPDLTAVTPQSAFRVRAWDSILVGVEICADHELHRVGAATNNAATLQLSPFFPGSIHPGTLAMSGVKDGGFILQNGGNAGADIVFKRTGAVLTKFKAASPNEKGFISQRGTDLGLDLMEYNRQVPPLVRSPKAGPLPRMGGAPQPRGPLPARQGPGLQRTTSSGSLPRRN